MFRTFTFALLFCLSVPGAAGIAAADATDSHQHPGVHGGVMADTNGHHLVELVTEGQSMTFYILHDDGGLEDVADAKATATILSGGKTEKVTLIPDGEALKGQSTTAVSKGDTVVITLTMPRHKPEQARFVLE